MALRKKQELFVKEYLVDLNATQAAIRAGYSAKTARAIGAENLTKPDIVEALQAEMDKRSERTEITADFVLKELYKIASQNADDGAESSLKYSNKLKALELLGKHLALFTEKLESKVEARAEVSVSMLTTEEKLRIVKEMQDGN